jgi:L-amino acid N-acyltransferase YncA
LDLGSFEENASAMHEVLDWMNQRQVRLASCRLDSLRLRESILLEENGFRFIEMVYSPWRELTPASAASGADIAIESAQAEDLDAIEHIAGTAFATGRYRLDWRLPADASDQRYRGWVRNSFSDPRHQVLKASVAGEIVGFFIVEVRGDASVYWHLTAIAPSCQGRGYGRRLWQAMVDRHRAAGMTSIHTTISAHNAPVLNIYAALGFRFGAPQMTFHWLRER